MLRLAFCGAQGATLAFVTTATMLADALTKALVHCPSLLAALHARLYDSSAGEDNLADALRAGADFQDGTWISADSTLLWGRVWLHPSL